MWYTPNRLDVCLTNLTDLALSHGGKAGGYPRAAIRLREAAMPRPLPAAIVEFYQTIDPDLWDAATRVQQEPRIYPIEKLVWYEWSGEVPPVEITMQTQIDWAKPHSHYLAFGAFGCGDELVWCDSTMRGGSGSIGVIGEVGDDSFLLLGDSLTAWLARFIACGCFEYALCPGELIPDEEILPLCEGEVPDPSMPMPLPRPLRRAFLTDHLRLNPADSVAVGMLQDMAE